MHDLYDFYEPTFVQNENLSHASRFFKLLDPFTQGSISNMGSATRILVHF